MVGTCGNDRTLIVTRSAASVNLDPNGPTALPAEAGHYGSPRSRDSMAAGAASRRASVREPHLADDRALDDVAEHVLLDVLVQQVRHLHHRRHAAGHPLHAEAAVDHRVGIAVAVVRAGEDVAPERLVRVLHRAAAEET